MRAFLRPASSPWIVFDRDSRVDDFAKAALRVGAVFASQPSLRPDGLTATTNVAPPANEGELLRRSRQLTPVVISEVEAPAVEPSNVVVATDILVEHASSPDLDAAPRRRSRMPVVVGALAGALAAAAAFVVVARSHATAPPGESAAAPQFAAAVVAPPEPAAEPAAEPAVEPPSAEPPAPAPAAPVAKAKVPTDPKKRFGKLTLMSDVGRKVVWFDGKRMLGSGRRSFLVKCGMHTIAVGDKTDAKDVEIPCNGEYVVTRKKK